MITAYDYQDLYEELGLSWDDFNCVMLKTQPVHLDLPEESLFYSDTERFSQGQVIDKTPHVTLLYGLLPQVKKKHAAAVLEGWEMTSLFVVSIDILDPPGKPYKVIVANVDDPKLREGHQRLSLLPHCNTFPTYKPHITIAYVKREKEHVEAVWRASYPLSRAFLTPGEIDFGDLQ